MSGARDGRATEHDGGCGHGPAGFGEYCAARNRYFERLRIDSEIRRLERAWQQAARGEPRDAGVHGRRDRGTTAAEG